MAEAADIQTVQDNIRADAAKNGWDETEIAARLDSGAIVERVIASYWRSQATAAIRLVNVSESGSSRGLDSIYSRMNALAESWETKADLKENPSEEASTARISSFPIKRV